jgi:hypothetical protein
MFKLHGSLFVPETNLPNFELEQWLYRFLTPNSTPPSEFISPMIQVPSKDVLHTSYTPSLAVGNELSPQNHRSPSGFVKSQSMVSFSLRILRDDFCRLLCKSKLHFNRSRESRCDITKEDGKYSDMPEVNKATERIYRKRIY